jgi:hypothetical protein
MMWAYERGDLIVVQIMAKSVSDKSPSIPSLLSQNSEAALTAAGGDNKWRRRLAAQIVAFSNGDSAKEPI